MIFIELSVDGFGTLTARNVAFGPRLNVVCGFNEAGKSTLCAALLASLYGPARGDKERWRPWSGARYATRLTYALANGRRFEVQRDFERDAKGVRIYDEHGNDASPECSVGKTINPGHAHLGIPLDAFVNASFVPQGGVAIDDTRSTTITHALARALDGGPREDAALGALKRLDEALAHHVGRKRATVNAPLRRLGEEFDEARAQAEEMRARLRALDGVRLRLQQETLRLDELQAALRDHERRRRALRAHELRARLTALDDIRDDVAALQVECARYANVADYPAQLVPELGELYHRWCVRAEVARSHADEAERARLPAPLLAEMAEFDAAAPLPDGATLDALQATAAAVTTAHEAARVATERAQSVRNTGSGGGELFGAALAAGTVVAFLAAGLVAVHDTTLAALAAVFSIVLFCFAWGRGSARRSCNRAAASAEQRAAAAVAAEREAAGALACRLQTLGVPSLDEFFRRQARMRELGEREAEATALSERARATQRDAERCAGAFDELAARLVPSSGVRELDLEAARAREKRKAARDGIAARLSMLYVRRADLMGSDDETSLEAELRELLEAGVEPLAGDGVSSRSLEAERASLERRASEGRAALAASAAELRAGEGQIGDIATLDERVLALGASIERIERFEAAVTLARRTIDERTRETHHKYARRLEDYASQTFAGITAGRYLDVRVDPVTLTVRARVPETGEVCDVQRLSAGTREQAHLVVRLAMARMFSEGLEMAPLLLDDPFAYWDETRIERGLPLVEAAAGSGQIVFFTSSRDFAQAAVARGACLVDLESTTHDRDATRAWNLNTRTNRASFAEPLFPRHAS